ncbi:MAG: SGNH/GDSL hydrolase family protein [Bacteroidota bacterium]
MISHQISRRRFSKSIASGVLSFGLAPGFFFNPPTVAEEDVDWHNVEDWGIEGKGWAQTKRYYDRLPAKAEGVVREAVWNLSRHSAGMCVWFASSASQIQVRYTLLHENLAMSHMPATGVSGLDLYGQDAQGMMRWVSVVRPDKQEMETHLAKGLAPGRRIYSLYLPLYNGVESLEIGVLKGESFEAILPRQERPMLFYGTSILHGACASRPGMAFPAILGRRLGRPTINLGFSGNGRMEAEVGALLAELDPSVFVIDCLPNMNQTTVSERAVPLVKQIRQAHSHTPILLVEDRSFTNTPFFPKKRAHHQASREALRQAHRSLLEAGLDHLYYLDGDHLLGLDGEAATDGSHPNDLGMVRYADAYEPVLRSLLRQY